MSRCSEFFRGTRSRSCGQFFWSFLSRTASVSKIVSIDPSIRRARPNALRRMASSRHRAVRCKCAPRPGNDPLGSGDIIQLADDLIATTRTRVVLSTRSRQPIHVRITVDKSNPSPADP